MVIVRRYVLVFILGGGPMASCDWLNQIRAELPKGGISEQNPISIKFSTSMEEY